MLRKSSRGANTKRTEGLPVFGLVDGEDDPRRGRLLLDGGQEGELALPPEQLHHSVCDVWRGMDRSPHIWRNKGT